MTFFFQNLVNALQWGSFYALIALGYSMVYGVLMLFNFAHGDIFMVGAYIGFGVASGLVALVSAGAFCLPHWLILVLTIIISMFLTSFVGMAVERIGYRPLREAPRASAAITGLMIGIILETGNLALLGARRVRFPSLIESVTYDIGGVFVTNKKIMIVVVSLTLMIALHQFVRRTKWGMAMRAMAFDYVVVPLMGVPINTIASMTFAIGSALAAAAGILFSCGLSRAGSLHGHRVWLEGFRGGDLGRKRLYFGCHLGRVFTWLHRNLRGHDFSLHASGPYRLFNHPAYSGVRPHGFFGEPYSARLRL